MGYNWQKNIENNYKISGCCIFGGSCHCADSKRTKCGNTSGQSGRGTVCNSGAL